MTNKYNLRQLTMDCKTAREFEIQQDYYAKNASFYNSIHPVGEGELLALFFLESYINCSGSISVLEIGSGTGRNLLWLKKRHINHRILGIEPSKELRELAYQSGVDYSEIQAGNALALDFDDGKFDIVYEFNMLHHVRQPEVVVSEMLRVAKKAVFIFDINNFGQGSTLTRLIKQVLNDMGLWSFVDFIKTGGKGYRLSEGDGLSYSYSVFNNYALLKKSCKSVHLLNTSNSGRNLYRSAPQVAILGIKEN